MDWKDIIGGIAPGLATALGGPLAGAAVKVIADKVLGRPEASQEEVIAALSSGQLTGDQVLALKQAEQSFLLEMERIEAAREQAGLADTQSARQQTVDLAKADSKIAWAAPVISIVIVSGFFGCIMMMLFLQRDWDERTANILNVLFGALTVGFANVNSYWLGSSAGSKRSGDAIRAAMPKPK